MIKVKEKANWPVMIFFDSWIISNRISIIYDDYHCI